MKTSLDSAITSQVTTLDTLESKTAYLSSEQEEIAPDFLDADQILNYVPLWPLGINVFSACFCMGCSAIYHLMGVKNPAY